MFNNLLREILVGIIIYLLGVVSLLIYRRLGRNKPIRKLWRFHNIENLHICLSTSTKTDTGVYIRYATGIGQVQALGHVIESLNQAYKIRIRNINMSYRISKEHLEKDLILIGGPKNNEFSKIFLEKIKKNLKIVNQTNECIEWLIEGEKEKFYSEAKQKQIIKDYGIAIRMKNPYDTNKKTFICLFSGLHTYGSIAASKYFTEHYVKKNPFWTSPKENVFLIVESDIQDGYPLDIRIVKKYEY